jgi:hypothetical protein
MKLFMNFVRFCLKIELLKYFNFLSLGKSVRVPLAMQSMRLKSQSESARARGWW